MDKKKFQSVVEKLREAKDKNGNTLNMDSIIISQGTDIFKHNFKNENTQNDLRSLAKPIIAISIGIAIENGLKLRGKPLSLDTKIFPFFKDIVNITNSENIEKWEQVTLRHLLTHSIGFAEGLMFSKQIKDKAPDALLDYIFNTNIVNTPGTTFVYSNVGPYLLSVLIQEELGIDLWNWINQILFQKIEITSYEWKNYGKYCAGATGLKLFHDDLHKIGEILINKGLYKGKRIVSSEWIDLMTTRQISTFGGEFPNGQRTEPTVYDPKRVFPKWGYGFFVYICENGSYYIDGTDGQYIIVIKDKGILITTFGHQSDMKPITECFRELL
jgi:CubicO group peptidase (beta-lactamase class C family)